MSWSSGLNMLAKQAVHLSVGDEFIGAASVSASDDLMFAHKERRSRDCLYLRPGSACKVAFGHLPELREPTSLHYRVLCAPDSKLFVELVHGSATTVLFREHECTPRRAATFGKRLSPREIERVNENPHKTLYAWFVCL